MRTKINKEISIGFIGIGIGLPMFKNLINSDFSVVAYDINPNVTKTRKRKNKTVNNLRALANNNYIISILPDTDVESVYNLRNGITSTLNQVLLSLI